MRKNRFLLLCAMLLGLTLLEGKPATATTLRALSLSQLASRAHVVAQIEVGGSYCEWRGRLIYTITEVTVVRIFKGDSVQAGEVARVVQLGGHIGDHAMPVIGGVDYVEGSKAVVFLLPTQLVEGEFYLAGMSQGNLAVLDNGALLWAPTALLWNANKLKSPQPRLMTFEDIRSAVEGL